MCVCVCVRVCVGWGCSYGRKRFASLYALLYIASCFTKHVNSYVPLMVGRLLGGAATSLLFSVFDAWLACEVRRAPATRRRTRCGRWRRAVARYIRALARTDGARSVDQDLSRSSLRVDSRVRMTTPRFCERDARGGGATLSGEEESL